MFIYELFIYFIIKVVDTLTSTTTILVVMTFFQGSVNPNPANTLMMLRQELNAVQLLVAQPVLQDFRHILVSMIQVQLSWQNEMVTALETCGFNVRLSDVGEDQNCHHQRHYCSYYHCITWSLS